jgi:subtilisin family serine protease
MWMEAAARFAFAVVAAVVIALAPMTGLPGEAAKKDRDRDLRPNRSGKTPAIVVLPAGSDPVAAARALGVTPRHVYRDVITGFAANLPPDAVASLQASRSARRIEADGKVSIQGEPAGKQGAAASRQQRKVPPQSTPTGVARVQAPGVAEAVVQPVDADIAVIDTGVARVPDLNVAGGKSCRKDSPFRDENGHGTHVAGTAAAIDNGRDVVGVAPGARVWAVKVLGADGGGRWSDVICGLNWVYQNRATIDVVNMSLAGPGEDEGACIGGTHAAICAIDDEGIPVVVAAGNQGKDVAKFKPAAYDRAITIAAYADSDGQPGYGGPKTCDRSFDDEDWRWSNFGADVDIVAPGSCIASLRTDRGVVRYSGTSMATPHVAGAIALYIAAVPEDPGPAKGQAEAWLLAAGSVPKTDPPGYAGSDLTAPALWVAAAP